VTGGKTNTSVKKSKKYLYTAITYTKRPRVFYTVYIRKYSEVLNIRGRISPLGHNPARMDIYGAV
jgi:hypothetical protein